MSLSDDGLERPGESDFGAYRGSADTDEFDAVDQNHLLQRQTINGGNRLTMFSANATAYLKRWVYKNLKYPFATLEEKRMLSRHTKLSTRQITLWLTNARRRLVPRLLQIENERRLRIGQAPLDKPRRGYHKPIFMKHAMEERSQYHADKRPQFLDLTKSKQSCSQGMVPTIHGSISHEGAEQCPSEDHSGHLQDCPPLEPINRKAVLVSVIRFVGSPPKRLLWSERDW